MVSFPVAQNYIYKDFRGIRTRNGVNTGGSMSATVCQNIDFIPNVVGSDIQIRTTLGNTFVVEYPDFELIKGFETVQDGVKYCILYAEDENKGVLLKYDFYFNTFDVIVDNLRVTGQANGITMNDTAYDVFVFTNGLDYYSVNFATTPIAQVINPVYDGEPLTGLAMLEKDGALVIGQYKGMGVLLGSRQGDIYDWDYTEVSEDTTKPWYQLFGKGITAVVPYIGGILVFTEDDSTFLTGNPAELSSFSRSDSSLGGCMSFESWCYHDKYLFFYDNKQKNIYYYTQIDTGQKILGTPIAPEVQKFFDNVGRLQMIGYVGENRSEIWVLSDKFKLIYDYFIGEWSERVCQDITSYFVYDNMVYSTTDEGKLLKEKDGDTFGIFDEVFYPSVYTMQTINLGLYSNMKEMEMQPIFTVTDTFNNKFWVDCIIDGNKSKSKLIQMFTNNGTWGDDTDPVVIPSTEQFDVTTFATNNEGVTHQVKSKFISNWYYLQFTIKTTEKEQDFNIVAMELKGITQETDTTGKK